MGDSERQAVEEEVSQAKAQIIALKQVLQNWENGLEDGNLADLEKLRTEIRAEIESIIKMKFIGPAITDVQAEHFISQERELAQLTPYVLLNPQRIDQMLRKIGLEIPVDEIEKMQTLLKTADLSVGRAQIETLMTATEEGRPPMAVFMPSKIIIDGQNTVVDLEVLGKVIYRAWREDVWKGRLRHTLALKDLKDLELKGSSGTSLRIYTTAPLKESKNKTHLEQIKYQKDLFQHKEDLIGSCEIDLSFLWALTLWNLQGTGYPGIIKIPSMQLNTKLKNGKPTFVSYMHNVARLSSETSSEKLTIKRGIGASCKIPPRKI